MDKTQLKKQVNDKNLENDIYMNVDDLPQANPDFQIQSSNNNLGNVNQQNQINVSNMNAGPLTTSNVCQPSTISNQNVPQLFNSLNINSNCVQIPNIDQKQQNHIYNTLEPDQPDIKFINFSDDDNLHVVSVIITICVESSYDDIFRQVQQKAPEGRVAVFQINQHAIPYIVDKFANKAFDEVFVSKNLDFMEKLEEIFGYIYELEPECILFNYECCSGCGDFQYLKSEETNKLIDYVLKRKSNFMFSDFAVKSLIESWDEKLFGKNPLKKLGEQSSYFILKFDPEILKNCSSTQLKIVGNLCEKGECKIKVLGGTIVFGIDKKNIDNEKYELEVLTVISDKNLSLSKFPIQKNFNDKYESFENNNNAQNKQSMLSNIKQSVLSIFNKVDNQKAPAPQEADRTATTDYFWTIKENTGPVGHVILKYKDGGLLMLSSGHWIELSHLETDITNLEKVSKDMYNDVFKDEIDNIKCSAMPQFEKQERYNNLATKMVQLSNSNCYSQKMVFKNNVQNQYVNSNKMFQNVKSKDSNVNSNQQNSFEPIAQMKQQNIQEEKLELKEEKEEKNQNKK